MRSARYLSVVGLWLTGCFDLDGARPECFADDPCANGAACIQGQCGEPPTRSVTLDISRCAEGVECKARWADATLCGAVRVDGQTAVGRLDSADSRLELVLPLGASTAQAAVFALQGDSCGALAVDDACDAGCVVAWGFAPQDVPEGPIALIAGCDDVRWPTAPPELCNSADDDCDGAADEEIGTIDTCTDGTGACRQEGALECVEGAPLCSAVAGMPGEEVLDDAIDNDCDGIIDEVPPACPPGMALPCETECATGARQCSDAGTAGPCLDADGNALPEPADEICNAADDDCDGATDEGFELGVMCNLGAPGCAAQGLTVCDGDDGTRCMGDIPDDLVERCDGLDNDCDGVADNGFDVGDGCLVGIGVCRRDGIQACDPGGEMTICEGDAGAPSNETCNGVDDDCDGTVDEDFGVGDACMRGEDACAEAGLLVCEADGSVVCDAPDPREPIDEICNAFDEDCDGIIDEGLGLGDACARGEAPCVEVGVIVCDANDAAVCDAAEPEIFEAELCDSADNDCDDIVDEGFDLGADLLNCGACGRVCAVPGAQNACVVRVCVADACLDGLVDLNGDLADGDAGDGCECVVIGADTPDADGVDANCDGVDGDVAASIFVDPLAGDGANPGTPEAPVATLAEALALVDGQRRRVLLSIGVHLVIGPQDVPDGVHIHGGYAGVADGWRRVARDEAVTTLQGPATVLRYANLVSATTLDRLDITTPDGGVDESTIAIVATNVDVHLTLSAVHVRPGRGGAGAAGVDGASGADALQAAAPGVGPNGGAAGANPQCPDATAGGNGANIVQAAGQDAPGGAPGGSSSPAGEDGLPGAPGERGPDGAIGDGASAFGAIVDGRWRLTVGTDGTPGRAGRGGGGGGAGGMEIGPVEPLRQGGGGGGGGAGGCAGLGGGRGGSGGASIALMVRGGQVLAIECEFFANSGGAGSVAGAGPAGSPGGVAAGGEPETCNGACGAGAPGGDGGDGGCGGPGGGGAGGPSIAVLGVGPAAPVRFEDRQGAVVAPIVVVSDPGAAGGGGAGCGVTGADGALGVALPIGCCLLDEDGFTCMALVPCEDG
ncbi:MAG: hypothetical protein ACI9U2_003306 [Bradymonadia bacterium]|jgi:hypothetical protein